MARLGSLNTGTDTATFGSGGGSVITGGGIILPTYAAIAGATIDVAVKTFRTEGFSAPGDMGDALYKRRDTTPFPAWASGTNYIWRTGRYAVNGGNIYQMTRKPPLPALSTTAPTGGTIGVEAVLADGYGWMLVPQSKAYVRSADRFKADGTGPDATHGGWWEIVPVAGVLPIECLGGKGDSNSNPYTPTGTTDNWQPLWDALSFSAFYWGNDNPGGTYTYTIKFGPGFYRISRGFDLHTCCHIRGVQGQGQGFGHTWLQFPNTVDPFVIGNNGTVGSVTFGSSGRGGADYSTIEHLQIGGGGGLSVFTDKARTMIKMRATATIRDVQLHYIPGRGIWINGGGGDGNVNNWHVRDVFIHEAGSDYFKVQGSDANGGYAIGLVTHGEGGRGDCGIIETGTLGCNTYVGCQITGYGNTGVRHGGAAGAPGARNYVLINGSSPTIGSTTTPGTNDLTWMDVGPSLAGDNVIQFPPWSGANTYTLQCPVFSEGGPAIFDGVYCENGVVPAHLANGAHVIGGNLGVNRYSNRLVFAGGGADNIFVNTQSYGSNRAFVPGSIEHTTHGEYIETLYGAGAQGGVGDGNQWGAQGGKQIFSHRRQKDFGGAWYEYGYRGADITYRLSGAGDFWSISGVNTARTFGRDTPQPHRLSFNDFTIHDATDVYDTGRIYGMRLTRPSSGNHARGEWVWPQNPTTWGAAVWVCTATGTPGTWCTVPLFGLTSIDPPNNGEMVIEATSNTSAKLKYRGSDGVVRSITFTLT